VITIASYRRELSAWIGVRNQFELIGDDRIGDIMLLGVGSNAITTVLLNAITTVLVTC
jgi:ABC-type proline/glycine betaine transport system permease subunit